MDKREFLKGSAAVVMMSALKRGDALAEGLGAGLGAQDAVPRVNWSGNYHYSTDKVFQPTTVA